MGTHRRAFRRHGGRGVAYNLVRRTDRTLGEMTKSATPAANRSTMSYYDGSQSGLESGRAHAPLLARYVSMYTTISLDKIMHRSRFSDVFLPLILQSECAL